MTEAVCGACGKARTALHICPVALGLDSAPAKLRTTPEAERDLILAFLRRRARHLEKKATSGLLIERAGFLMHAAICDAVADMIARGEHLIAAKKPKG